MRGKNGEGGREGGREVFAARGGGQASYTDLYVTFDRHSLAIANRVRQCDSVFSFIVRRYLGRSSEKEPWIRNFGRDLETSRAVSSKLLESDAPLGFLCAGCSCTADRHIANVKERKRKR